MVAGQVRNLYFNDTILVPLALAATPLLFREKTLLCRFRYGTGEQRKRKALLEQKDEIDMSFFFGTFWSMHACHGTLPVQLLNMNMNMMKSPLQLIPLGSSFVHCFCPFAHSDDLFTALGTKAKPYNKFLE